MQVSIDTKDLHKGLDKLERVLKQFDKDAVKHMGELGEEIAKNTMQASIARSPVDEGDLEKAHRWRVYRSGGSLKFDIFIDPSTTPRKYALYVHELVTPGGWKKLGPKSQLKQSSSSVTIGGKFLERAVYDEARKNRKILVDGMRKFMRRASFI